MSGGSGGSLTSNLSKLSSSSSISSDAAAAVALSIASSLDSAAGCSTTSSFSSTVVINLMQFPNELLEKIFSFLDFKTVCHLRMVNRRLNTVCGQILSSTFMKLQTTMLHRFQSIKAKMPRRESARRQHPLACESDIIEMLHMRLTLLQMSFGKHIERKHCCFFAGGILDEIYGILHYIRTTPRLARPYKVTDELFDLTTMAMEYFKEKIEPTLPEITYFGTDFMDIPISPSKNDATCGSDSGVFDTSSESSSRSPPQSNMVLRKRIHKIKQGMKRYSSQLTLMKRELKLCKTKLVDQQKTVLDYATRLDDYDKKNEETSRKFSNLLQEFNKCKTELQFLRSNFPFNPDCTCGVNPTPQTLVAYESPLSVPNFIQMMFFQDVNIPPGASLNELSLESANIAVEVAAEPLTGSASPRAEQDVDVSSAEPSIVMATSKKQRRGRHVDGHSSDSEPSTRKQLRNSTRGSAETNTGNEDSGGSDHETSHHHLHHKKPVRGSAGGVGNTSSSNGHGYMTNMSGNNHHHHHHHATGHSSVCGGTHHDPCLPNTSGSSLTLASPSDAASNIRPKKRKAAGGACAATNTNNSSSSGGVICETKSLRGGTGGAGTSGVSSGGHASASNSSASVAAGGSSLVAFGACKRSRR